MDQQKDGPEAASVQGHQGHQGYQDQDPQGQNQHDQSPGQQSEETNEIGSPARSDDRRTSAKAAKLDRAERKALERAERQSRGPGAWRTWVLPSLRLLVFAVIAIALVKFAFFPDQQTNEADGQVPTAVMEEPQVTVTVGTVVNDVELQGSVVPGDAVQVRATQTGKVNWIGAEDGATVAEGDMLYQVQVESQAAMTEGETAETEAQSPTVQYYTITAPASGVLTGFDLLVGQEVQIATDTGSIQPPTFRVRAPLTAEQQYRLTTEPSEAEVQIPGGPAPFECTNLEIVQPTGTSANNGGNPSGNASDGSVDQDGSESGTSSAVAVCDVPDGVRVFSGLASTMTIAAGVAEDVLVLPTTAVLGSADSGTVFQVGDDGEPVEVPVTLGLNDGSFVEIVDGLSEGDSVLEMAPGAVPVDPCADPESADPSVCGEVYVP